MLGNLDDGDVDDNDGGDNDDGNDDDNDGGDVERTWQVCVSRGRGGFRRVCDAESYQRVINTVPFSRKASCTCTYMYVCLYVCINVCLMISFN